MATRCRMLLLIAGALAFASGPASPAHGGVRPPARFGHSAVYDLAHDRLLVFGGNDGFDALLGDLWVLPLAGHGEWTEVTPAGALPPARANHTAVLDLARDRIVVFGGAGDTGLLADVWALSLSGTPVWTKLAPAGSPPSARALHSAVFDAVHDRMLVFGGLDETGPRRDLWALTLGGEPAWAPLAAIGPPPAARYQHSAIYDTELERMVVFGGTDLFTLQGDAWSLETSNRLVPEWKQLRPAGAAPSARSGHAAVYDPAGRRMIVFGGWDRSVGPLDDIWTLSLGADVAWDAVPCEGVEPCARTLASATLDVPRNRLVVFGGTGSGERWSLDDAWALPLPFSPRWSELAPVLGAPTGTPALEFTFTAGPSPCRGALRVSYSLPSSGPMELSVHDLSGRLIQRLVTGEQSAGPAEAVWDAAATTGGRVQPGVYFVRLASTAGTGTRRVVMLH